MRQKLAAVALAAAMPFSANLQAEVRDLYLGNGNTSISTLAARVVDWESRLYNLREQLEALAEKESAARYAVDRAYHRLEQANVLADYLLGVALDWRRLQDRMEELAQELTAAAEAHGRDIGWRQHIAACRQLIELGTALPDRAEEAALALAVTERLVQVDGPSVDAIPASLRTHQRTLNQVAYDIRRLVQALRSKVRVQRVPVSG